MSLLAQVIAIHIQPVLQNKLQSQDPESLSYGQLIIAFGNANIQQVVEQPGNEYGSATIIKLHLDILRAPGHPGDDDELSTLSIEFWNTYIEYVNDTLFSRASGDPQPDWLEHSRAVLTQVVEVMWNKMCLPSSEVAAEWTEDEREALKEFRLDATDCMLSMFLFSGNTILQQLVSFALHSLENGEWRRVEASLFCLNALADNILEDQASEDVVRKIFESSLFRAVRDFSQPIPSQVRRTAIDMLGSYGQYIERHAEFIEDIVLFLFTALEAEQLANAAAKSIASLCSTCRASLTKYLPDFLQQYQTFLSGPTSDPYTKEKVIGAIAAIIQALKPKSAQVQPLLRLLENVDSDILKAKESAAGGDMEMAEVDGVSALNCLASIGKGMQVLADLPITLYDDEDETTTNEPDFWHSGEGKVVPARIVGCFSVLQILGTSGDAIEAACQVLRAGFAEVEPGPFVLPPSVTVSFLNECTVQTPQVESVIATACTLITQHSRKGSKRIDAEVTAVCQKVPAFMQQLGTPSQDPSVAQSCIDVLGRLSPYYTHVLFDPSLPLQAMLDLTLQAIDGQDVFPKRSATEFWAKLIKPFVPAEGSDTQARLNEIVAAYGPSLSLSLMRQIGGLCQRSELDVICEPLKALVTSCAASKQWLEAALISPSFPAVQPSVDEAAKRMFLQQLVGLRGDGRKTKDVVKRFWAECRGTVSSYTS